MDTRPLDRYRLAISQSGKSVAMLSAVWCVGVTVLFARRTNLSMLLALPLVLLFLSAGLIACKLRL